MRLAPVVLKTVNGRSYLRPHSLQLQTQLPQGNDGEPHVLMQQSQQDMLGSHVIVVEAPRLLHRILDDLLGLRHLRHLDRIARRSAVRDEAFDLAPDGGRLHTKTPQHVDRRATALVRKPNEDVFAANIPVLQPLRSLDWRAA